MSTPIEPTSVITVEPGRVIDGDTVVMIVKRELKVRLAGIDTYEPNDSDPQRRELGLKAKLHVLEALQAKPLLVRTVKNKDGSDKVDSFGRLLAEVFYEHPENGQVNLNQELITLGLAIPYVRKS